MWHCTGRGHGGGGGSTSGNEIVSSQMQGLGNEAEKSWVMEDYSSVPTLRNAEASHAKHIRVERFNRNADFIEEEGEGSSAMLAAPHPEVPFTVAI